MTDDDEGKRWQEELYEETDGERWHEEISIPDGREVGEDEAYCVECAAIIPVDVPECPDCGTRQPGSADAAESPGRQAAEDGTQGQSDGVLQLVATVAGRGVQTGLTVGLLVLIGFALYVAGGMAACGALPVPDAIGQLLVVFYDLGRGLLGPVSPPGTGC